MATAEQKELALETIEADDGSAVVELDEKMLQTDEVEEQNGFERAKDGGSVDKATDSADDDHPDDDDELRNAKRNRRRAKRDLVRKTNQEKDVQLATLKRENEEFKRRLSLVERSAKTEGLIRIDKNLEDANYRVEYAKLKLAEATQNADGQAMVEAQTLWNAAQREVDQLTHIRRQADQELRQPQQQQQGADPTIQRFAQRWMARNSWYNPSASDPDSRVAKKIDELMGAQGWDPADPDYWDELDSRLQKELPHRYNETNDEDSRNVRRPRNVVGSSGREASAAYGGSNRTQFVLSPERVKAMKESGSWDNPERKARMIKQFIAYDRANRN
jgi:hypothetical protein